MGKTIDITEQLNFEDNPKIKVRDQEVEVKTDATTALQLMGLVGDGTNMTPKAISDICELLFSKEDYKKITALELQFEDFTTLVKVAMTLITGGTEESGE